MKRARTTLRWQRGRYVGRDAAGCEVTVRREPDVWANPWVLEVDGEFIARHRDRDSLLAMADRMVTS